MEIARIGNPGPAYLRPWAAVTSCNRLHDNEYSLHPTRLPPSARVMESIMKIVQRIAGLARLAAFAGATTLALMTPALANDLTVGAFGGVWEKSRASA